MRRASQENFARFKYFTAAKTLAGSKSNHMEYDDIGLVTFNNIRISICSSVHLQQFKNTVSEITLCKVSNPHLLFYISSLLLPLWALILSPRASVMRLPLVGRVRPRRILPVLALTALAALALRVALNWLSHPSRDALSSGESDRLVALMSQIG